MFPADFYLVNFSYRATDKKEALKNSAPKKPTLEFFGIHDFKKGVKPLTAF